MNNNDILKRIRFVFDFNDLKMTQIFDQADLSVSKEEVRSWLTHEDDRFFIELSDKKLAIFLNGLINEKRGKREGPLPAPEEKINNNLVLKKLKIALDLKSEDVLNIFKLVNKPISVHEVTDFLRNPKQNKYKVIKDQYLRNFLEGLQVKYRDNEGIKHKGQ